MPAFYISDYSDLGNTEGWNPLSATTSRTPSTSNASWIEGQSRHPVWLRLHAPPDEPLAAGTGRRSARCVQFRSWRYGPESRRLSMPLWDSRADTPSFENGWNGLAAFLLGTPTAPGRAASSSRWTASRTQWALYVRDRWRATPKLTLNLGLRWELYPNRTRSAGMGIESYDPDNQRRPDRRRRWHPAGQRSGLQQEAVCTPCRFRLSVGEQHGDPKRLRHHLPLASLGRSGIARLVSADDCRGPFPGSTATNRSPRTPITWRRASRTHRWAPMSVFYRSAARISARGGVQLPSSAEMGYPVANQQLNRGYIQSWNFIIEHKLPGEMVTSVGYVGTASVNGFAFLDINAVADPRFRR